MTELIGRPPDQRREELLNRMAEEEKDLTGPRQGPAGSMIPQTTRQRMWLGKVTDVQSNGGRPLYSAEALDDSTVTVTRRPPRLRQSPGPVLIEPPRVGILCIITEDGDGQFDIAGVWDEIYEIAACEAGIGMGNTISDSGTSELEGIQIGSSGPIYPSIRNLHQSITFSVINATTQQYGVKIYTFPVGIWQIQAAYYYAKIASPSITRPIRLALSTADATGSTGTNFSAANEDVLENLQSKSLSTGSALYTRSGPLASNFPNDSTHLLPIRNALAADIDLYLNICQTNAGGWNASDDVTIDLQIALDLKNLGSFT